MASARAGNGSYRNEAEKSMPKDLIQGMVACADDKSAAMKVPFYTT